MKRCQTHFNFHVNQLVILPLALMLSWCEDTRAQTRVFPATAKRGVLVVTQSPDVLLNDLPRRLSPGARIKAINNLLVMPATLTGKPLVVNYLSDSQGLLHEIWILSSQESSQSGVMGSHGSDHKTFLDRTPQDHRP